jgi:ribosome-binding protein aMBF1 (putative translation factor)
MQLDPVICRTARASLGWSQAELAKKADFTTSAIGQFEAGRSISRFYNPQELALVFEAAGVSFVVQADGRIAVLPPPPVPTAITAAD